MTKEALILSKQNFDNFINSSLLAIYFFNIDTKKVIYANPAFFHLLGYVPDELDSLTIYDFVNYPKEDIDAVLNKVIQTKQYNIGEREWKCKDGKLVNMSINVSYVSSDNERVLHVSAWDITEQRKGEKEKEKLLIELSDKYNQLMQFNYIVAHNLRSPIANIIGLVNVIELPTICEKEKPQIIEYIKSAAVKMDEMVKDLSIILATQCPLNDKKENVSIPALIHSISDTLEKQIFESNCSIKTDIAADAKEVFSIKSYMESILYNLISNAIKFKVPVRAPQLHISSKKVGNNYSIKVSDNGRGIDLTKHGDSVFGLYKRFHLDVEGKGLGLHMAKTQVEALGGKITIESQPDKGTTFKITLPIQ